MNTRSLLRACGLYVCILTPAVAELAHETFESRNLGQVNTLVGWGGSATGALVSSAQPFSSAKSLELPDQSGFNGVVSAMYTGFNFTKTPADHAVIRLEFELYLANTNVILGAALGTVGTPQAYLLMQNGSVFFNTGDTGRDHATGRYAQVVMYYDMIGNRVSLDYDHVNVVPWTGSGLPATSSFNMVSFSSQQNSSVTEASIFIDNIVLETFPADTVSWWRFQEGYGARMAEQTGRFPPVDLMGGSALRWDQSFSDPLNDGSDVRNPYALVYPNAEASTQRFDTIVLSNWTAEAIFRTLPGCDNFTFFCWNTGAGYDTTNSRIDIGWYSISSNLLVYLRDDDETDTDTLTLSSLGVLPADGQWHQVALMKSNNQLHVFRDYQFLGTHALGPLASGAYRMESGNHSRVGILMNNGNAGDERNIIDEIRITARALDEGEFLQPGQPIFLQGPVPGAGTWDVQFVTLPGTTNKLEARQGIEAGPWSHVTTVTANHSEVNLTLPPPDADETSGVLRVRRDWVRP